jgi:hypothetical protein
VKHPSLCILPIAATLASQPAVADDAYGEPFAPRTIAGHRFVPSSLVLWGFVDSTFAMTTSAGYEHFDRGFDVDPALADLVAGSRNEVRLIGVAHSFTGAAALAPWLAVTGRVTSAVEIPRGAVSALVVGAHMNTGLEGGLVLRLVRLPSFQISARGDYGWADDRDIQPRLAPASLFVNGHIQTLRPALIAALALSRAFAVQASGSYTWRWFDIEETDDVQTLTGALAVSLSLYPAPVTILAGGQVDHEWGRNFETAAEEVLLGNSDHHTRGELGLFYTGRRDLDLGAVATYQFSGSNDRRWLGNIRFGYYF